MLASILTIAIITAIIVGVSTFAYRRISKVSRENAARTAAHEARLLAEVKATVHSPSPASPQVTPPVSDKSVEGTGDPATSTDDMGIKPESMSQSRAEAGLTVQDEIRAFLGDTTPDTAPDASRALGAEQGEAPGPTSNPVAMSGFDKAVRDVAQALRDAATRVEETASGAGTQQERAARTLMAVTAAVGALPLASLSATETDESPTM